MTALLQPGFDRVQRHALLGVQFRDAATGRIVDEGLQLTLQDLWRPHRVQALQANRSGTFVLHAAAGMPGIAAAPPPTLGSPAEPARYQLQVLDTHRRYLPTCLQPELPTSGLWAPAVRSPATATSAPGSDLPPHVPLFSAATRQLPPALGSLRAELRRASQPAQPVPWARLELWMGSTLLAQGQADEGGRALLLFALPRPREAALGASPAGQPPAFEWTVNLRAFWNPAFRPSSVPTFDDVFSQPAAVLLRAPASAPAQHQPLPLLLLVAGATLMAQQSPESYVYVAE